MLAGQMIRFCMNYGVTLQQMKRPLAELGTFIFGVHYPVLKLPDLIILNIYVVFKVKCLSPILGDNALSLRPQQKFG